MLKILGLIGHICLFVGGLVLVVDVLNAFQTGHFSMQPLGELWSIAAPRRPVGYGAMAAAHQSGGFLQMIFAWPAALDFLGLGLILSFLGAGGKRPY